MHQNKTLGHLKKRILDVLDENSDILSGEISSDTNLDVLLKRMPDCINASLLRMYESLPIENSKAVMKVFLPREVCYNDTVLDVGGYCDFNEKIKSAAVIFGYFGRGKVSFLDENDSVLAEIILDNTNGELEYYRKSFTFEKDAAKVLFSDGITIKDFTVYKNDQNLDGELIPPYGYVSFKLPERMQKLERVSCKDGKKIELFRVVLAKKAGYIQKCDNDCVIIEYKKSPLMIDENTEDSFVIEFDGCAFEALVCLAASELCTPDRQSTYSRLIYKYLDLSESLYTNNPGSLSRNGFYKKSTKKGWQ